MSFHGCPDGVSVKGVLCFRDTMGDIFYPEQRGVLEANC